MLLVKIGKRISRNTRLSYPNRPHLHKLLTPKDVFAENVTIWTIKELLPEICTDSLIKE